uniref:Transposase n=1 Tax=Globodera rostochiensis TaxID=31243 RepID=A0A914HM81_GLORO
MNAHFKFLLFATNSLDKAESVKVKMEETPLKSFDEIFGDGWWDKGEAEDLKTPAPTNFGQNVHHQIDRQNTQIGQIEPNSTDQNPPLTESDHSDNAKNGEEMTSKEKRNIIDKFHEMKDEFKQKTELTRAGFKNSYQNEINETVAKELGLTFVTIYNWKRKLGQTEPTHKHSHSEQKKLMKQYYEIKGQNPKISDANIVKMLKIGTDTLVRWKRQFKRQQNAGKWMK